MKSSISSIFSARFLRNALIVIFGNFIYAVGVVFFILPSGLITGGTTGIGLIVNHYFGLNISITVGIFNVAMFILGALVLGIEFALTTLISTIFYPVLLGLLQNVVGDFILTRDMFLSAIFGGLCIGISLAMIIRLGASTGGMDIPPLVLNKLFRIPVSVSLYVFDFMILIGQMFFSAKDTCLYGILLVIVYTVTLDKLLAMGTGKTKLEIVSQHSEALKDAILSDIDRGVTLLHGKTGYLGIETDVISCIIAPRELYKMEKLIHEVDPNAFIVLSKVSNVTGRGFSREKKYLNKDTASSGQNTIDSVK